jgi:hypothetical protein
VTEIESLRARVKELENDLAQCEEHCTMWAAGKGRSDGALDAMKAERDQLMLEFCPNEMTPEQIKEWEEHQIAAPELHKEAPAKIKMWQWLVQEPAGRVHLTAWFHASELDAEKALISNGRIIGKAAWTEIEV